MRDEGYRSREMGRRRGDMIELTCELNSCDAVSRGHVDDSDAVSRGHVDDSDQRGEQTDSQTGETSGVNTNHRQQRRPHLLRRT